LQAWLASCKMCHERERMKYTAQAGAIVIRQNGAGIRILLIRPRRSVDRWIFPKGTVEPGESAEDAAVREAQEEAGVEGEVLRRVGRPLEFENGRGHVRVQYFLLRMASESPSPEGRQKRWCSPRDALARVSFGAGRKLLRTALASLDAGDRPDFA
jgi:8-oxo-dGTP pyrophosphatase MutT (NUDIX family)